MEQALLETLPPPIRLALAYAPKAARADWLTLLAFDQRLAGIVRKQREPIFAQLQLAWWRDRLREDTAARPSGEPLLARLSEWHADDEALIGLVDGWELRIGDESLGAGAIERFAAARGAVTGALADRLGADDVAAVARARRWSLAEIAAGASDDDDRQIALGKLAAEPAIGRRSERTLRPLHVLERLALGAVHRDKRAAPGLGALLAAVRVGLIGR